AQYTLTGLFSQLPFGNFDNQGNGSNTICGPFLISDGTPEHPGGTNITLFINANMTIHRVIVSDSITHQLMGDLVGTIGNLDGSSAYAVLNNHPPEAAVTNKTYLFDDSLMMNVPGARHSDGPGSLADFGGKTAGHQWQFTMEDNALNHTGQVECLTVYL